MGAGSITSNVKSDKKLITIKGPDGNIDTGIKKIGAFLGDNVEIGCGISKIALWSVGENG